MLVQLVGMVSQLAKVRYIIKCLELFLFKKYLQNVYVMWMVQWITAVLMMVVFVHVLPMSLVINVIFVQLGGMDSQPVKVKYVIKCVSTTVGPCTVQKSIQKYILHYAKLHCANLYKNSPPNSHTVQIRVSQKNQRFDFSLFLLKI